MTDYTSEGAVPIEDAAVEDPPTVDEVLEEQRSRSDLPDPSDDPSTQQVDGIRDEQSTDVHDVQDGDEHDDGDAV